jgi:D-alanyl-lipoteichoic acid acyltransferase DltB (MBOAT superfamily)
MTFDSYEYVFLFLPAVYALYRFFRTSRYHNLIIVAASLYFYAHGQPTTLLVVSLIILLGVSLQDYFIGNWLTQIADQRKRFWLVTVSVAVNLLCLAVFKYANWLVDVLNLAFAHYQLAWRIPLPNLVLPAGISFYTFHTISYTVDIYRGIMKPRRSIIDYLSFVAFFPLLVAGPIQRAAHLLPQIARNRPAVTPRLAEEGIFLICWGLTKKMVFADNLGKLVETCQGNLNTAGPGLILAYAFCFQIYFDFSAYTDIARGTARLFNIRLTKNFFTPYFSSSPSEFWRRWHISLSTFLRDYLYIILGGNRKGEARTYANLLITMILGGIWHGAGVFFFLWGLYHGLLLALYRKWPIDQWLAQAFGRTGKLIALLLFFHLTVFGWILFFSKPDTFGPIVSSIGMMFTQPWSPLMPLMVWGLALYVLPMMVGEVFAYRRNRELVDLYPILPTWLKATLYVAMFYSVIFFSRREGYGFIYFQF